MSDITARVECLERLVLALSKAITCQGNTLSPALVEKLIKDAKLKEAKE